MTIMQQMNLFNTSSEVAQALSLTIWKCGIGEPLTKKCTI